jgi:aryl-alcohol dehydrogenase-like predicted oxidoreductase
MTSVLVYGGAALADVPDEVADRSIELALDAGINHFDTAAGYGGSEVHLGRWMSRIRDDIFLATKTGERTAAGAYDSVRRSLDRLQTSRLDLIQHHAVGDLDDLDRVTGSGGALEGTLRARDEGLVRAVGITGHGMRAPAVHHEALRRYPFDTVITPFNYRLAQDARYARDFEALLEAATERDVGVRTIKTIARNLWPTTEAATYATWYQPMDEQAYVTAALSFVLARPGIAGICTAGDVRLLPLLIRAERDRHRLSRDEALSVLAGLTDYEPPFVRVTDREIPDWLEPLVEERER